MSEGTKVKNVTRFIKSDLWIILLDIIAVIGAYWLALNARFIGYAELGKLVHSYLNTLFLLPHFMLRFAS